MGWLLQRSLWQQLAAIHPSNNHSERVLTRGLTTAQCPDIVYVQSRGAEQDAGSSTGQADEETRNCGVAFRVGLEGTNQGTSDVAGRRWESGPSRRVWLARLVGTVFSLSISLTTMR